jgi:hypothetical protein
MQPTHEYITVTFPPVYTARTAASAFIEKFAKKIKQIIRITLWASSNAVHYASRFLSLILIMNLKSILRACATDHDNSCACMD